MRVDHNHYHRKKAANHKQPVFANPVSQLPHEWTGKNGNNTGNEENQWQLRFGDEDVVLQKRAAERHDHESARGKQHRRHETADIEWVRNSMPEVMKYTLVMFPLEMGGNRFKLESDDNPDQSRNCRNHQKRCMPVQVSRKEKSYRNTQHLA